jgi:hypothetical protein
LVNYNDALCIGSVAKLAAGYLGDNNKYEWSNGKTGQTIDVTQSTELTVVAVSPQGCHSTPSSPYKVTFINHSKPPKPSIKIVGDTAFCAYLGKKVNLNATAGYKTYLWSTGQTTQNITTMPDYTQKYSVSVTDEFGCQSPSSDTVTIRVKDTPYRPSINRNGNILSVFYTTGVQWFLNGVAIVGAKNPTYTPTANGFYTVQITSAEGCVSEMSNWVNITGFPTAVNNLKNGQKFDVSPNPIQDILTVYTEGVTHSTVSITDAYGRIVRTILLQEKAITISTTDLPAGMYAVSLINVQGRILSIKKIIKI